MHTTHTVDQTQNYLTQTAHTSCTLSIHDKYTGNITHIIIFIMTPIKDTSCNIKSVDDACCSSASELVHKEQHYLNFFGNKG